MKILYLLPLLLLSSTGLGSDLIHSFKSPAFNGFGYSSHMMMTENVSRSRKQAVKDSLKIEAENARIAAMNTPLNNFINNLQARIYSQLAANLTDEIFNSSGASFGAFSLQGGATITWTRAGEFVTLYIVDPATGTTTSIQVPVGTLGSGGGG